MESYTIPYLYRKDSHWSAVDIHNDNSAIHVITVRWLSHPEGVETKKSLITLQPKSSHLILPTDFPDSENGRHIMKITGPNHLYVTHVYVGPWQMVTVEADK